MRPVWCESEGYVSGPKCFQSNKLSFRTGLRRSVSTHFGMAIAVALASRWFGQKDLRLMRS